MNIVIDEYWERVRAANEKRQEAERRAMAECIEDEKAAKLWLYEHGWHYVDGVAHRVRR